MQTLHHDIKSRWATTARDATPHARATRIMPWIHFAFRHKQTTWALTNTLDRTMHRLSLDTEALRAYRVVFMICVLRVFHSVAVTAAKRWIATWLTNTYTIIRW